MTESVALQPIDREQPPWVRRATRDAIRHFAWGIGDNNPLWIDPDYAAASPWGGPIAPPCFLYAVDETTVARVQDNLRRIYHAVEWTFHDVIKQDAEISAQATLIDEEEVSNSLMQTGRLDFRDGESRLLASAATTILRTDTPETALEERPEIRYSGEELEAMERTILGEKRQGAEPLYVEDIQTGAPLGPLIKGPLSIMDIVAWSAGTGGAVEANTEHSEGGLPNQCATGPQQVSWIGQAITDWMGDAGFLYKLNVRLHTNPPLGSATTITGTLREALQENQPSVALQLAAADQNGHVSADASAIVWLPSRRTGPVRLPAP